HYALWKSGIYHRDVNCDNLKYYWLNGKIMAVLNDYDLASLATSTSPLGNERTGTIPFMVIDFLSDIGQDGELELLYRHNLESFIWVFIWIC
ncbi:hypothetical protein BU15DRAFT_30386, partial [Melanogaster broomeanus]